MNACCQLVAFDLTGTTVHDDGQIAGAFRTALAAHDILLDDAALDRLRGRRKRDTIAALLPPSRSRWALQDAIYRAFGDALQRAFVTRPPREIDGARRTFETLHADGMKVAITTGLDREVTYRIVEALGWTDHVLDTIVCGDDVVHGRPAPDLIITAMTRCRVRHTAAVMSVGDTVADLEAGAAARAGWNVGVLTGAHGRERLSAAPHTHLLASVALVPAVLTRPPAPVTILQDRTRI
jgi:phosphonatase-like hydrolase